MKNLLLASTALVALAGAASAEVALSGTGRMGMVYDQDAGTRSVDANGENYRIKNADGTDYINPLTGTKVWALNSEARFSSRMRLLISMSFEFYSGLTFGGSFRADNAADANNGKAGSVFVSGDFGTLAMGDVSSAAEAAVGDISGVGYTGLGDLNETFYLITGGPGLSNDDNYQGIALPGALYTYTTGDVSLYVGMGNPAGRNSAASDGGNFGADSIFGLAFEDIAFYSGDKFKSYNQYSLGAAYGNDQYKVGIGFESATYELSRQATAATQEVQVVNGAPAVVTVPGQAAFFKKNTVDAWYLGGQATWGDAVVKAMWGEISDVDLQQYGLSLDYTFDAFTATAFVRQVDLGGEDPANCGTYCRPDTSRTIWGLGGAYDLGGGVVFEGGVVDPDTEWEDYRADIGVNFSF